MGRVPSGALYVSEARAMCEVALALGYVLLMAARLISAAPVAFARPYPPRPNSASETSTRSVFHLPFRDVQLPLLLCYLLCAFVFTADLQASSSKEMRIPQGRITFILYKVFLSTHIFYSTPLLPAEKITKSTL